MTIGEKIKFARISNKLTQKQLGEMVRLSDVRIRQYELNTRTPKENILKEISRSTGFPIEFFTNPSVDTYNGVIQILNMLEEKYGFSIKKSVGNRGYNLTIDNKMLDDHVSTWLKGAEEIMRQKAEGSDKTDEQIVIERQLWKFRFPKSDVERFEAEKNASQKNNRKENPSN